MIKYPVSIFLFHRDLRLADNNGLIECMKKSELIVPLFIFTPTQVSDNNTHRSDKSVQFMVESLIDLDQQIFNRNNESRLWTMYGDEIESLQKIIKKTKASAIFCNDDYTPYANSRDIKIFNWCRDNDILFFQYTDCLLVGDIEIKTGNDNYYRVYTPFYNNASQYAVTKPVPNKRKNIIAENKTYYLEKSINKLKMIGIELENPNVAIKGGRKEGLKIINNMNFATYAKNMDLPSHNNSRLSAHNKYGTVSIREVYYSAKNDKTKKFIKNLYWRDFYYYIAIHFDGFFDYKHLFIVPNNDTSIWVSGKLKSKRLNAWKNGLTGFPIVDAGMRELAETGFIHNRARLIVAEFLIKDLLIDWKHGEQYFSSMLVDIDRCQNMGNWNWAASFGMDATPFLRIFNPWSQSKKYDPKCEYIKNWLPELDNVDNGHLHRWDKNYMKYDTDYPAPIVDHATQRKIFIDAWKSLYA
jgi:deoxyribodipyrimidine photo-lyase